VTPVASAAWPAPSDADAVVVPPPPPHLWPLPAPRLPSPPAHLLRASPRTALYCPLPSHTFTCSCAVRPGGGGHPAAADVPRVLLARLQAQLQQAAGACASTSGIKHTAVQPMECACTECASLSSAVCTLQPTHPALACGPLPRPRCSPGPTRTSGRRLSASRWRYWSSCSSCRGRQVGGTHLLCCCAALRWSAAGSAALQHQLDRQRVVACAWHAGTTELAAHSSPPDAPRTAVGFAMRERPPDALLPEFSTEDEDQVGGWGPAAPCSSWQDGRGQPRHTQGSNASMGCA
jgi:hypothetical protein